MRKAKVLFRDEHAGWLTQFNDGSFAFQYTEAWINNPLKPAISLTLPKVEQLYRSDHLLPFFFHMLPEGTNKQLVCYHTRIEADDDFGILLATAHTDTIGAVRILRETEP